MGWGKWFSYGERHGCWGPLYKMHAAQYLEEGEYYGLNCVTMNSHVEALIPNVTVFGDGVIKVKLSHKSIVLIQ